jgi:small-conductance mechanosensitive channel
VALRGAGRRYVIERVPGSRIRRSTLALWLAVVGTLVPALALGALVTGLRAGDDRPLVGSLVSHLQMASLIAALIWAMGGALLQRRQPSWRLIDIADGTAHRLRPMTFAASAVTILCAALLAISDGMGASGPLQAAVDAVTAIIYIALVMGILVSGARARAQVIRKEGQETGNQSVTAFLSLAAWGLLIVSVVSLLGGYIAFAFFLLRFMIWAAVVAATLYLLLIAVDDICTAAFDREGRLADTFYNGFGVRRSLIDQFGVAVSALARLLLILLALGMVSRPFGANVSSIFDQLTQISQGVTIGQITISPGAILRAVAVLAVGLFMVRALQRWLTGRYLPATDLDRGRRIPSPWWRAIPGSSWWCSGRWPRWGSGSNASRCCSPLCRSASVSAFRRSPRTSSRA